MLPIINIRIKVLSYLALIDSGASTDVCGKEVAEEVVYHKAGYISDVEAHIRLPDGNVYIAKHCLHTTIHLQNFSWKCKFLIMPKLPYDFIIGSGSLRHMRAVVDYNDQCLKFSFKEDARLQFNISNQVSTASIGTLVESPIKLPIDETRQLQELLDSYQDTLTADLGRVKDFTYRIYLNDNTPVHRAPYPLTPPKTEAMREHVQELLKLGIIEKTSSPYSSPCFLIPKKNGGKRLVVDYREVNKRIIYDAFPVPKPESVFQCLHGAVVFSKLDLNMAYHQLPLSEESKPITAFNTTFGAYHYNFLPFGLAISSAGLNRIMNEIFGDLHFKFVVNYFDDLLVYSKSLQEHLQHLREVFERLRQAGFTVNPAKAELCMRKVKCLGHVISADGCQVDDEKVKAVRELPTPKNLKQLRTFMGMAAYFARFIPGFSEIAAPLNHLKKKNIRFNMGDSQVAAIQELKEALATAPVLKFPDFQRTFVVRCDASDVALGAVLLQEFHDGMHPIAYASRKLSNTEKRYIIFEREALGAIFALEKFHDYVIGRHFVLQMDNQALTWMIRHPQQLGKVGRWVLKLTRYDFEVQHIRSSSNSIADSLSRCSKVEPETESQEIHARVALNNLNEVPQSFFAVKKHQETDPESSLILQRLRAGEDVLGYVEKEGVLLRIVGKNRWKRIFVPINVRQMLLYYFHDNDATHPGVQKSYRAIARRFWWPNMYRDILQYVRSCEVCQRIKPHNRPMGAPMSSTVPIGVFEKVYIDFCGPLLPSSSGNRYVLVLIDAFSKWLEVIPCRRATAEVTCKKLIEVWCSYGPPKILVSDNATVFRSNTFQRMTLAWGIKHVTTSPYQPSSNMVERSMRDLKSSLSIMVRSCANDNHKKWDTFLPLFRYSHNSNVSEVSQQSPSRVFLGREMPRPLDRQWDIERFVDPKPEVSVEEVALRLQQAHQKVKALYDLRHPRSHPFQVDQLVLQRLHTIVTAGGQQGQKFTPRWSPPRKILRFTSPTSCVVVDAKDPNKLFRTHISQLKPYRVRQEAA